jgi:integrating conjugative element membrane protein (TIGR03745 family)
MKLRLIEKMALASRAAKSRWSRFAAKTFAAMTVAGMSMAANAAGTGSEGTLPTVEDPQHSNLGSGIFGHMEGYVADAIVLGGVVLTGVGFLVVAVNGIKVFHEVQAGRKSWTDFAVCCMVGVVLLVLCIYLATQASQIFSGGSSST